MVKQADIWWTCNLDTLEPISHDLLRHETTKTHHQYYQHYS